ncbi:DUF3304 domain-containing protein [Burkholderia lata]|uniref:DUF3304 domain-containing protein n=1 Tax=Burkholderia lata (strain ATCC 17760 / DSM 23089 / LMG 22485 / NCIMB 9086 / R18194 / 383) TaxID=482957 RepID=UPI00145305BA|nr:DUF3304 domain-containing protein [Burkholderia lata]VWM11623.1 hypothetical protein BLA6992_04434 [Burkholderia lata]
MLNFLRRLIRNPIVIAVLLLGGAWWVHAQTASYGPYRVIGYNFTNRSIYSVKIDEFGAGNVRANKPGGGGGTVCCMDVPRDKKTWHIKLEYELTQEQYKKNLPSDVFETDIAIPPLPDKHDGYIEFYFLPQQKIEARWAKLPTDPHNPNLQ